MAKFEIRNLDSLDTRDAKFPPELVKALYELQVKSILDIGCGSGWLCDYMPKGARYLGFDRNQTAIENALKLHPEGQFLCTTIEALASGAYDTFTQDKFDCAFLKCIFCVVEPERIQDIISVINKMVSKYVMLYDTEKQPGFWSTPFQAEGYHLIFNHMRGGMVDNKLGKATYAVSRIPSFVQIWSVEHAK